MATRRRQIELITKSTDTDGINLDWKELVLKQLTAAAPKWSARKYRSSPTSPPPVLVSVLYPKDLAVEFETATEGDH